MDDGMVRISQTAAYREREIAERTQNGNIPGGYTTIANTVAS